MNARGANCYCSPYNGCFHKHFQVIPQVSIENNTGLISGKNTGEHDFDYIIEVTATNNAGLTTILQKKAMICSYVFFKNMLEFKTFILTSGFKY
jgi:hypothetical protein